MNKSGDEKAWISFCMSTYNRPQLLKNQLELILKQINKNFEVVISDNDPQCSAEAVVKELDDKRLKYFSNINNLGMVKSFNKSIERATTPYVVMITDDDPVAPDMLEDFHKIMTKYPSHSIYFGCRRKGKKESEVEVFNNNDFVFQILHPQLTSNFLWSGCILKRDVILKFGGMPDYGSPHLADHAMLALCGKDNGGVLINKMYSSLSSHETNFSKSNYHLYYVACLEFYKFMTNSFDKSFYIKGNENALIKHLNAWYIAISFNLRKYFTYTSRNAQTLREIHSFSKEILKLPFMKHLTIRYYLKLIVFSIKKPLYLLHILR